MSKLDPRRWRVVGDVVEHHCAPCNTWLAATPANFHKHSRKPYGVQDYCKRCMIKTTGRDQRLRRQQRRMCMLRALAWAQTLPPLIALDRITEAWAHP